MLGGCASADVPQMFCMFGCNCRAKLKCMWVHRRQLQQWFKVINEQLLLLRKMMTECSFWERGECRYGERCMRSQRDGVAALQREVYCNSPAVVLQRSVYEERMQPFGGRWC